MLDHLAVAPRPTQLVFRHVGENLRHTPLNGRGLVRQLGLRHTGLSAPRCGGLALHGDGILAIDVGVEAGFVLFLSFGHVRVGSLSRIKGCTKLYRLFWKSALRIGKDVNLTMSAMDRPSPAPNELLVLYRCCGALVGARPFL